MPNSYGSSYRRRRMGKKYYKKKNRKSVSDMSMRRGWDRVVISRAPFPRQMITTMRYCTAIQLDPGSAGIRAFHRFSANGIYDPDVTGTGHQPHGHDQYQTIYQHYKVIGSKITAYFSPAGAQAGSGTMVCAIQLDDDVSEPPSDIQNVIEGPETTYTVASNADGAPNVVKLVKTFSPSKFLGVPKEQWRTAGAGQFGANPPDEAYYVLYAAPVNQTQDADPVNIQVEISYIVHMYEPRNLPPS